MNVKSVEEICYKKVHIELSCGESFWVDVYIETEINVEWVKKYLISIIKEVSFYEKDMEFDWYISGGAGVYQTRFLKTKATNKMIEIINMFNEGASNCVCKYGTRDKEGIKLLVEEII